MSAPVGISVMVTAPTRDLAGYVARVIVFRNPELRVLHVEMVEPGPGWRNTYEVTVEDPTARKVPDPS